MSIYTLRGRRKEKKPIAEKKTLIEADTGVLTEEGDLYDLENIKRAYFAYEDKD